MAIESKITRGPIGRPMGQPEKSKKGTGWIWIIPILVVLIGGLFWWYYTQNKSSPTEGPIASGEYQAVFLDSGQVYFGKLNTDKKDFYQLTDVFYLQTGTIGLDQVSNLSLIKLGNEAHGPEDKMEINKDHVLFIEDMKGDSKVVQAIQDYKTKKK